MIEHCPGNSKNILINGVINISLMLCYILSSDSIVSHLWLELDNQQMMFDETK